MFGKYEHAVDAKGRIFVPAKLKEELGETFYVTPGLDHCLSVYTEPVWQSVIEKLNTMPLSQSVKMRFLFANAFRCEPDKQGRVLLPGELRKYACISDSVTFIGQGSRAEIWDSETYNRLESETLTPEYLRSIMEELNF